MNKEDIFKTIIESVCEILPELKEHSFKPDDRLAELGANSVDRAEIVALTMENLSLQVPMVELAKAKNIGQLAEVFYEKLQQT
ncbi:MAG: acyl carrier protein [Clostridia bacterium]|nr:acyl carrier protein [Clostridia bacterium]